MYEQFTAKPYGRRVRALPQLADAWKRGELSGGQVEAIVKNVPDKRVGLFAEHEAAVVPALVGLSANDTARAMRDWSARADALADDAAPRQEPVATFHLSKTLDGQWVADGTFDTEGGAVISKAIDLVDSKDFRLLPAQRRAQALVAIAVQFLDDNGCRPPHRTPGLQRSAKLAPARLSRGTRGWCRGEFDRQDMSD